MPPTDEERRAWQDDGPQDPKNRPVEPVLPPVMGKKPTAPPPPAETPKPAPPPKVEAPPPPAKTETPPAPKQTDLKL